MSGIPRLIQIWTTYKKDNINDTICQKPRNKNLYETDMHKIYNIIVDQNNEQFQDNVASDATLMTVKIGWDPIG